MVTCVPPKRFSACTLSIFYTHTPATRSCTGENHHNLLITFRTINSNVNFSSHSWDRILPRLFITRSIMFVHINHDTRIWLLFCTSYCFTGRRRIYHYISYRVLDALHTTYCEMFATIIYVITLYCYALLLFEYGAVIVIVMAWSTLLFFFFLYYFYLNTLHCVLSKRLNVSKLIEKHFVNRSSM